MNDGGLESESESFVDDPAGNVEKEIPPNRGGGSRLFILLLIVVGAAGAGFYLFGQELFVSDTPVAQLKSKKPEKIKMPIRTQPAESSEGVKEEVVSLEKVAAVVTPPAAAKVTRPAVASFALTAGSFLYRNSLEQARALIEKLGYKVDSSQSMEPHEVTRLRVGLYGRPLAEKRLAEVKRISDGAFIVAEEGKFAVYAGSFLSLDKARRLADMLYQKGVRVDERQVKVDLPRTTLRFGEFVERSEARKIMKKLEKMGMEKLQIVPFK